MSSSATPSRSVTWRVDAKDAEWIADLVRHGLIAKSFVRRRRSASCCAIVASWSAGRKRAREAPGDGQHQTG